MWHKFSVQYDGLSLIVGDIVETNVNFVLKLKYETVLFLGIFLSYRYTI